MKLTQKFVGACLFVLVVGLMMGAAVAAPKNSFVNPLGLREVTMDLTTIDQFNYENSTQYGCYYFRPTASGKYDFFVRSSSYNVHAVLYELNDAKALTGKRIELARGGTIINRSIELKRSTRYMLVLGKKIEMAGSTQIGKVESLTGNVQVQIMYNTSGHTINNPFKLLLDQEIKERIRTANQTDFYRFVVPYNGEYTFAASDQVTLQLLDGYGWSLGNAGTHDLSKGQVYYLRLFKGNSQLTAYRIKATLNRVDEEVPVKEVKLNATKKELLDDTTFELKAKTAPAYAEDQTIQWKSLHPHIAKVDKNGLVTALTPGVATITATSSSGVKATCQIKVVPVKLKSISIKSSLSLAAKKSQDLEIKFNPANATIKTVKWVSSNPKVVSVDSKGKIKALAPGKAVITVVAKDGNRKSSCAVTVAKK